MGGWGVRVVPGLRLPERGGRLQGLEAWRRCGVQGRPRSPYGRRWRGYLTWLIEERGSTRWKKGEGHL